MTPIHAGVLLAPLGGASKISSRLRYTDSAWPAQQVDEDARSDVRLVPIERVIENVDLVVIENVDIDVIDCRCDRSRNQPTGTGAGAGASRHCIEFSRVELVHLRHELLRLLESSGL